MSAKYFLKKHRGLDEVKAEVAGLKSLSRFAKTINIPQIIEHDENSITLEFIPTLPWCDQAWEKAAIGLAQIHGNTQSFCGAEQDNYIGLSPQKNNIEKNWGTFFTQMRLSPQLEWANQRFSIDLKKIEDFLNEQPVRFSPLHGDLWSGNILNSTRGPFLIDPSFYLGDPEVDLAMSEMFGGFSKKFYAAYFSYHSRSKHYEVKKEIYNLYHWLNHYNLFGLSYQDAVIRTIDKIRSELK